MDKSARKYHRPASSSEAFSVPDFYKGELSAQKGRKRSANVSENIKRSENTNSSLN